MQNILTIRFSASTHVLVRPIGLDTLKVDGSCKCDPRNLVPKGRGTKPAGAKQAKAGQG